MRLAILLLAALPVMADDENWNPFKRWLSAEATSVADVEPAATLSATLPEGRRGVVYAPRRAVAYPLQARTTVPAGEDLWLLVLQKTTPVALFPIPAIEAKTERTVDARGAGVTGVLAWLELPEADRAAVAKAKGIAAPIVRAEDVQSDPLPPLPLLHGAFVLLRDVPAGDVQLDVGGREWLPSRRSVKVGANNLTVVPAPLLVRGAAALIVHWSGDHGIPDLERSVGWCKDEPLPQYEVILSACGEGCSPIRKEVFVPPPDFSSFAADGLVPGTYRAELRFGKLPPRFDEVAVAPLEQREMRVRAYYEIMYGSLTLGGEPLGRDTTLELGGGIGFASAESDEYRAAVIEPVEMDGKIEVATCDGTLRAVVLADRSARPNSRFDVDVPNNALRVNVIDTFTRMPLANATVTMSALTRGMPVPVLTRRLKTNEQGDAGMKYVPVRDIHLTVNLSGYEKAQVPPFSMPRSGEKAVDVDMVPVRGTSGKIISRSPFENASIAWYSTANRVTEHADIAEDGTFMVANAHSAEETMVVVSSSHPLWVRHALPTDAKGTLQMRFPDAPARDFEVRLRGAARVLPDLVGLAIGGVRVPYSSLRQHLSLRDAPALRYLAIAETGPIDVVLNRASKRLPPGAKEVVFD